MDTKLYKSARQSRLLFHVQFTTPSETFFMTHILTSSNRAGRGWAGQGRTGQGRAGRGEAGQGRAGHGRAE